MAAENTSINSGEPVRYRAYSYRWVVLSVYMFISALTQLYWLNFSAIDTYLEKNMNISTFNVGMLALVFPIVYIVLAVPAGIIIDRKGFKYGVFIGTVFTGLFSLVRLINPASYTVLLISQIGIAVGQPFVLNGITKLVTIWFPIREEATAVGLGSLSLFVGMIICLGLTPVLVDSVGFKTMLWAYAALGMLGILAFLLLVRSNPPTPARKVIVENTPAMQGIRHILKIKNFIILGFIALIGIGVFNGLATWLEKILNEIQHISMVDAGAISAVLIFAGTLGCFVIPLLSDKLKKRKPFLIMAALIGMICVVVLMIPMSYTINMVNSIMLGFFLLPALPIMLTMSVEITGAEFAGISVAYLQLMGNAAAIAIVPIMEILRGVGGSHVVSLAFIAVLLFAALIMALRVKETYHSL